MLENALDGNGGRSAWDEGVSQIRGAPTGALSAASIKNIFTASRLSASSCPPPACPTRSAIPATASPTKIPTTPDHRDRGALKS